MLETIDLFNKQLFPILFPFLIILNIVFQQPEKTKLINFLHPLFRRIFKTSKTGTFITCLSSLSSFPIGAWMINDAYLNKSISKQEAEHLLMFTNQASPAFITAMVSGFLLQIPQLGVVCITIQWLTNMTIGFFGQYFMPKSKTIAAHFHQQHVTTSSLQDIIINSARSVVTILGVMLIAKLINRLLLQTKCYLFLAKIINHTLPLSLSLTDIEYLLQASLELTQGIVLIEKITLSFPLLFLIANALINFHGFSVHLQIYSLIRSSGLSIFSYLIGRLSAVFISLFYSYTYLKYIYPTHVSHFAVPVQLIKKIPSPSAIISGLSILYLLLFMLSYSLITYHQSKKSRVS